MMAELSVYGFYHGCELLLEHDEARTKRNSRVHIRVASGEFIGVTSWCKHDWSLSAKARRIIHQKLNLDPLGRRSLSAGEPNG